MVRAGLKDYDEILKRIANGEEKAYADLFAHFHGRLYEYIYRLTKNKEVAEELVLDVFLKLWQGKEVIAEIQNMDGFLFKIAYRKSIDFLRSAVHNRKFADLAFLQLQVSDDEDPAAILMRREYDEKLREAIALLPPQRQKVFQMAKEGKSYVEIAKELSISVNTVNKQVYEARAFIRSYIAKNFNASMFFALIISEWVDK